MRRLVTLLVVIALTAGCSSSGGHGAGPPIPAVNATAAPGLPTTANALPDITPSGLQQLLSRLHGIPVVLNGWGSWCGPCREEGPRLAAAARRSGSKVQFLGLDVKDSLGPARAFVKQMGWTYPSLFDPSPTGDVERQLGFFAQPVTVFYDRTGKRVALISGPASATGLRDGIARITG